MSQIPYASAVGSIMYAMTCTRTDVAFALMRKSKSLDLYEAKMNHVCMSRPVGV